MESPPTPEPEPELDDAENEQESPGQRAYRQLRKIASLSHDPPDTRTDTSEDYEDVLYPKQGQMP